MSGEFETLADVVHSHALRDGDRVAFTFLSDGAEKARSLSWSQLHRRASALAGTILASGGQGRPVLLALPSGLGFVEALFACWYAGAAAVPLCLPRHQRVKHRLDGILSDASAALAIGDAGARQRISGIEHDSHAESLRWIDYAGAEDAGSADLVPRSSAQNLAVLQYTSGSTGLPRGVMVTHANLMCNSAQIAQACGHDRNSTLCGWLPLYHDMGLVGLLQAAFAGAHCVFMTPERFLMQPVSWLQAISNYRACSSPAPNFAYDLCAERVSEEQKRSLDLSCWRNALNGAEPVRAGTLDRFARDFASCGFHASSFFPCYGLAEATLLVTGPKLPRRAARLQPDGVPLPDGSPCGHVGCGSAYGDTKLAIVDPQTKRPAAGGAVGEIWVSGASVARGYWNNAQATLATFNARLESGAGEDRDIPWLRTGDLGMFIGGELFVTGRLRELIILAGRNHFPVDLEQTVESADLAVAPFGVAAFSVDLEGTERLIVVAELRREYARAVRGEARKQFDAGAVIRRIRAAVAAEHEVMPYEVVLVRPGTLARTTSGKLSRSAVKADYLGNALERWESQAHERVTV